MIFEIVCKKCGTINRDQIPLIQQSRCIHILCNDCEFTLLSFYGDDHGMSKITKEDDKRQTEEKIIK